MQLGVNCLASFVLTKLLTPVMVKSAKDQEPGTVRVMWVSSSAAELTSPSGGGVELDNLDYRKDVSSVTKYSISKAGMIILSQEYARRYQKDGIISVIAEEKKAMNPGNLKTGLRRHLPWALATVFGWMSFEPVYGAYTELFSGFSKDITMENSGCWVVPWGQISPVRKDIRDAARAESDGGSGLGAKFWDWCEKEAQPYIV